MLSHDLNYNYYNEQAEMSILGTIIMSNHYFNRVSDILESKHFYHLAHQKIFEKIASSLKDNHLADSITLKEFFNNDSSIGCEYISSLISEAATITDIRNYAFHVIDLWQKRQLLSNFQDAISNLKDKSVDDIILQTQELFNSIESESDEIRVFNTKDMFDSLFKSWQDGSANRITSSGIEELDKMINGGFYPQKLYIVGGSPGAGKTIFSQQIIENALRKKYFVLFFSMEMPQKNILARFIARIASISVSKILTNAFYPHEEEEFTRAGQRWTELAETFFMTEKGELTVKQIEKVLKNKFKKTPIDFVVVDYIQVLKIKDSPNINEATLIKRNTTALKEIAKKYNCSVIALSQITKNSTGDKPTMRDLKGSGGIAEDADCVITLHQANEEKDAHSQVKTVNLSIVKNRDGICGEVSLDFDGAFGRFTKKQI